MGVVTVSSSAGQTPLGLSTRFSTLSSPTKRVSILAFKANKPKNKSLVAPQESICLPIETSKESPKRLRRNRKSSEPVRALPVTEAQAPSCTLDLDFNKAAAKLENLYKLSPPTVISDTEDKDRVAKKGRRRRKRVVEGDEKREKENIDTVVRSQKKKVNRLSLEKRIALGKSKELEAFTSAQKRKHRGDNEYEKINRLVREYSASTNLNSLDWRKMKIPPVLPSSEHAWLFKLMQPMKVSLLLVAPCCHPNLHPKRKN